MAKKENPLIETVRPADENRKMQDAYLDHAHPNTAMEQAGLKLGSIASHIETQYYALMKKIEIFGKNSLTRAEKEKLVWFSVFVVDKIPSIAAQEGSSEVAKDLRDTFKHAPAMTYPQAQPESLAAAMTRELTESEVPQKPKQPDGQSKGNG